MTGLWNRRLPGITIGRDKKSSIEVTKVSSLCLTAPMCFHYTMPWLKYNNCMLSSSGKMAMCDLSIC